MKVYRWNNLHVICKNTSTLKIVLLIECCSNRIDSLVILASRCQELGWFLMVKMKAYGWIRTYTLIWQKKTNQLMQPFLQFIWQWFTIVISGVMETVLRSLCLSAVSKLLGLESWDVDVFSIPGSTLYLLIQALPLLGLTTLLTFLLSIYWPLSLLNQNSFSSCGIPPRIPQSKHPRADNN